MQRRFEVIEEKNENEDYLKKVKFVISRPGYIIMKD